MGSDYNSENDDQIEKLKPYFVLAKKSELAQYVSLVWTIILAASTIVRASTDKFDIVILPVILFVAIVAISLRQYLTKGDRRGFVKRHEKIISGTSVFVFCVMLLGSLYCFYDMYRQRSRERDMQIVNNDIVHQAKAYCDGMLPVLAINLSQSNMSDATNNAQKFVKALEDRHTEAFITFGRLLIDSRGNVGNAGPQEKISITPLVLSDVGERFAMWRSFRVANSLVNSRSNSGSRFPAFPVFGTPHEASGEGKYARLTGVGIDEAVSIDWKRIDPSGEDRRKAFSRPDERMIWFEIQKRRGPKSLLIPNGHVRDDPNDLKSPLWVCTSVPIEAATATVPEDQLGPPGPLWKLVLHCHNFATKDGKFITGLPIEEIEEAGQPKKIKIALLTNEQASIETTSARVIFEK